MGSVLSSDITSDIESAWAHVDKQHEGSIPRNLLQDLIERVLASSKLSISKDQALSYCSPYLTGMKISKQQVLDFCATQKLREIASLELEAIKNQVEFYFSDENLAHDKFFHELISSDTHGFVSLEAILKCQRIKNLKATKESVLEAVATSELVEVSTDKESIRRAKNKSLPLLQVKKSKKNQAIEPQVKILSVTVPEENKVNWKELRDSFRSKYIDTNVVYVRFHGNEGHVGVTAESNIESIVKGGLDINSTKAVIKALEGDELLEFWKANGSHFDMCSQSNKRRKVEHHKGVNMGGKMFSSVSALKNYVTSLLNGSAEGVIDPHYHNLMMAVFRLHPEYDAKSHGLKTFAIGRHPEYPDSKCFFVVKEDGTRDDFSITKCLQQL